MDDGEQILTQLGFGRVCLTVRIENCERCARSFNNPFDELDSKPRKPVPVGNDNCRDRTILHGLQKPREPAPLEVDARRNVLEHSVARVRFLHGLDLAGKIVLLLCRRHSAVHRPFALLEGGMSEGDCAVVVLPETWHAWVEGSKVKSTVPSSGATNLDFPVICPRVKSGSTYPEDITDRGPVGPLSFRTFGGHPVEIEIMKK